MTLIRRLLLAPALVLGAAPAQDPAPAQGPTGDWLDGLSALADGRLDDAVASLSRAIEILPEDPKLRVARGVALLMAEKPEEAEADLERARRLAPQDRQTCLWRAAADRMQARFFTEVFPQATNDPFESAVGEASAFWGQTFRKVEPGYEPSVEEQARRRAALSDVGRWFAERERSDPSLAKALFAQGKARCDKGEWLQGEPDIAAALAAWPDDPTVLGYWAGCRLVRGDLLGARRLYTRVLTARSDWVAGYLGRALAAARLGDARRAQADLKAAAALDERAARAQGPAVEQALETARSVREPALRAWLDSAASRVRFDETYQDELRRREDALRREPKSASRLADLAAFLYTNVEVRRERVEPSGEPRRHRWQTPQSQKQELARAETLCDQALALDAACVKALATKAAVRMWNLQFSDAETLLRRAVALAPTDAEVLELLAQVLEVAAVQKRMLAQNLRTPTVTHTSTSIEGDYEVTRTWWRYPSAEDLARAKELDRQAEACLGARGGAPREGGVRPQGHRRGRLLGRRPAPARRSARRGQDGVHRRTRQGARAPAGPFPAGRRMRGPRPEGRGAAGAQRCHRAPGDDGRALARPRLEGARAHGVRGRPRAARRGRALRSGRCARARLPRHRRARRGQARRGGGLPRLFECRACLAMGDLAAAKQIATGLPGARHGAGPSKGAFPELEELGQRMKDEVARLDLERRQRGDESSSEWHPADQAQVAATLLRLSQDSGLAQAAQQSYAHKNLATPLGVALQQAVTAILTPKSVHWREQTRQALQQVAAERARLGQRAGGDGRRDPRAARDGPIYSELAAVARRAEELLGKLAIERGYPAADLARGSEAGEGASEAAPGPGDGAAATAYAAVCKEAGLPFLRHSDRFGVTAESMLSLAVRQTVEAIEGRKTAEWQATVERCLHGIGEQRARAELRRNDAQRRIADLRARASDDPRRSRQLEQSLRPLEQQLAEAQKNLALSDRALAALRAHALTRGFPAEAFDGAAGTARAGGAVPPPVKQR